MNVCFGGKAVTAIALQNVRYWTKADMRVKRINLSFLNTLVGDAKGHERIGRALGHNRLISEQSEPLPFDFAGQRTLIGVEEHGRAALRTGAGSQKFLTQACRRPGRR